MMQIKRPDYSPYGIDLPGDRKALPGAAYSHTPAAAGFRRKAKTMRISDFCFIVAGLAALVGMTMGIVMGLSQDFTLAPAHAHMNLLGWVTMALYGLYHRGAGRKDGRLGWTQAASGALGAVLMSGGLAGYLSGGDERFMPLVIIGSILAFLAMAMFLIMVLGQLRTPAPAARESLAHSG